MPLYKSLRVLTKVIIIVLILLLAIYTLYTFYISSKNVYHRGTLVINSYCVLGMNKSMNFEQDN